MSIDVIKQIAEIPRKNGSIKLAIIFNGEKNFLDIRYWVDSDTYTGPTKKGLWLDLAALEEINGNHYLEQAIVEINKANSGTGLQDDQEKFIKNQVEALGSIEKVEAVYHRDDKACDYARGLARKLFK